MSDARRAQGKALAEVLMIGGCFVALSIGYGVANSGNSDGLLGLQEALVGGAVAAGILAVVFGTLIALARRFDLSVRRDLTRMFAWVLLVPAGLWTVFYMWILAVNSGSREAMSFADVAPDWAIIALPLFVVSVVLFLIAGSRSTPSPAPRSDDLRPRH
jgi:hypothetical protein